MKIGILSMQHVRNYGSFLQAYALKTTLESLGHQCEFIDIETGKILPGLERNIKYLAGMAVKRYLNWSAIKTFVSRLKCTKIYQERFDNIYLKELGIHNHTIDSFDLAVIGSDEVFNFNQHTGYGFTTQLYGEVKNAKRVISYAGSFGTTTVDVIDKYGVREAMARALNSMAAISVRDKNSFEVVRNLLGKEPSLNVDPVLMFDYQKYAVEPKEKDYIVVYSYPNRIKGKEEIDAIRAFAKEKGKKLISICFYFPWCDETIIPHPFEVLGYIKNADYVITDTFHGCVMSIKFNKQFVALVRDSNRQKMSSLMDQFGLGERVCESFDDLQNRIERQIDYVHVNDQIANEKEKSLQYLKANLTE